jgi:CRP-like cAMP-binding protein
LIISGKVSCRLPGGICIKYYTQGSYFGDIDALNHMRRLFTVRAEEPLKLAVLDRDQLEQVLSSDPSNRLVVREKTLKRYISYLQALKKIKHFFRVSKANEWWEEQEREQEKSINKLIEEWLNVVLDYKKKKRVQP